jgi:anti-sigma regulatory factor (Ser/Thr protein kinase)
MGRPLTARTASLDHPHTTGTADARARRTRAVIDAGAADPPALRRDVHDLAVRAGFGDRAGDLTLAVAELLANALEHGRPPVVVEGWFDGRLVIEVTDSGAGMDRDAIWRTHPPGPSGDRGRGLWIVRQLVDVVTVRSGPEGTTVHVELSPEPHIGA